MYRLPLMVLFLMLFASSSAFAVYEKKDGFPWNLGLHGEHDKPLMDALGTGFFMNVGPTGIRAQITHEHPAFFTVKFVFANSPAAGKIKAGDIIVGANNHVMDVPHQFGRRNVTGWAGPMEEMAKLIEDSQGKDGELELMVWRGGDRSKAEKVMLKIRPVGRFSKTFPFNCERSDKLMIELCDFLANDYERTGKFGRQHTHAAGVLALMASGENKYTRVIERVMSGYPGKRYSSLDGGGFQCWTYGLDGIVMGEYYLLTKDQRLIAPAQSLAVAVAESQNWQNGGYSHKPYPFIQRRIADGGPAGYGPMSGVTGLVMLGQSLFKAGGLEYSDEAYQRMHQGYLSSWTDKGYIDYGMASWHHAVIEPVGESIGKATNKKGIGYPVPTGMQGVDQFKLIWPTPQDNRGGSTDWLNSKDELARARVVVSGENQLIVIRDLTSKGLTRMPRMPDRPVGHIFRSGGAALAHAIGNEDNQAWQVMSQVYAHACAASPNAILDGHASTLMHTLWGSLGAAHAGKEAFVRYTQGMKWWFIMAQTHDGSFVPMPGRDYASTDHVYAGRTFPTATAALILSVKEAKLRITGATGGPSPESPNTGRATTTNTDKTQPASDAPQTTLLGEDFKIVHCQREARALNADTPYAQVLRMLDQTISEPGAHGKEAIFFGIELRDWITRQNAELIKQAKTKPAHTLAHGRDHARRLAGYELPDAAAVRSLIDELHEDRDVRMLARYIELLDNLNQAEARRGGTHSSSRERDEINTMLDRFIEKPGLSPALTAEAKALRVQKPAE